MVDLYLTGKCRVKCPYCYAWKRLGYDMPPDVLEAACIYINKIKAPIVKLWGGEPLENRSGVKYALGHARPQKFTVTTNGVCLDDDLYEWLLMHHVEVALSWDGTEESQNKGRNNTYSELMKRLPQWKRLIDANGGQILKTVAIPELLYDDVKEIYNAGFKRLFLNFFRAYGAMYTESDLKILEEQYHRVIKDFHMKPDFTLTDVLQYQNIWDFTRSNLYVPHCGINAQGLAVGPDGLLYPCGDAPMMGEEFSIGNVWDGLDEKRNAEIRQRLTCVPDRCTGCDLKCYPCPVCSWINTGKLAADPGDMFCALRHMQFRVVNQYRTPVQRHGLTVTPSRLHP